MFVGYEGTGAETRGNSAVNVALWDILGQATGRPVVDLLGGRTRDSIRIYNTCAGYRYGRGNQGALRASDRATAADRGLPAPTRRDHTRICRPPSSGRVNWRRTSSSRASAG